MFCPHHVMYVYSFFVLKEFVSITVTLFVYVSCVKFITSITPNVKQNSNERAYRNFNMNLPSQRSGLSVPICCVT